MNKIKDTCAILDAARPGADSYLRYFNEENDYKVQPFGHTGDAFGFYLASLLRERIEIMQSFSRNQYLQATVTDIRHQIQELTTVADALEAALVFSPKDSEEP